MNTLIAIFCALAGSLILLIWWLIAQLSNVRAEISELRDQHREMDAHFNAVISCSQHLGKELKAHIESTRARPALEEQANAAPVHERALKFAGRLFDKELSVDEVAAACDLNKAEADFLYRMHRAERAA